MEDMLLLVRINTLGADSVISGCHHNSLEEPQGVPALDVKDSGLAGFSVFA